MTSPDPSEAAVTEGPDPRDATWCQHECKFNEDGHTNGMAGHDFEPWTRRRSAPERPDPGWFLDDEGNADQLLPALASAYHHSRHVKPSRLPDHSASWRDCSEGMCRRAQAALRAERVERPSLDVADVIARTERVKRHASNDRPMVTWVPAADFDLIVEMLRAASPAERARE